MSQIQLYLDEDAQRASFVLALRKAEIDVITVSEAGRIGRVNASKTRYERV